jgi:hypothetical protein
MPEDPKLPQPGQPDPYAPKHLGKLFEKVQQIVRDGKQRNGVPRRVSKKGEKVPNKYCDVCSVMFYEEQIIVVPDAPDGPTPKTCQDCQKEFAQGGVAVIAPDGKFSFIWGASVVDLPQKNYVSQQEYDAIVEYTKSHPKPEQPT